MSLLAENLDGNNVTGYNEMVGGDDMKARDVIQAALSELGIKQESLAVKLGVTPQNLSRKLLKDTIRAKEFFDALDALGLKITVSRKDTGDVIRAQSFKPGVMPRVSMVVNGIRYDTEKADALCHYELDALAMELYRDYRGGYFVAIYVNCEGGKPHISVCDESYALRLYEAHRGDSDPHPDTMFEKATG